ncbi:MAG: hypothetical protein ACHQ52_08270 [Candidatus Eisenbacteria bacterium]
MELSTPAHLLLARAALATGNPDALDALVRAALSAEPALRDGARAVLLAEARSRGVSATAPEDGPVGPGDYRALREALVAARSGSGAGVRTGAPRWLVVAAAMRERWSGDVPTAGTESAEPASLDRGTP